MRAVFTIRARVQGIMLQPGVEHPAIELLHGGKEDSLPAAGQARGVTTARRRGTAAGASVAAERSASATSTRAARGRGGGAARPTCTQQHYVVRIRIRIRT